jgi:hypothetical protein
MDAAHSNGLPQRRSRVGSGPKLSPLAYTAPPDVIAKFLIALQLWDIETPGRRS